MQTQKVAHSAMLISTTCFFTIGFLDFFPLFKFYYSHGELLHFIHGFLSRFKPLHNPYYNKLFLLFVIIGSVMLYYPKKKEGRKMISGVTFASLGCFLLMLSDFQKEPQVYLYWFSVVWYILGFVLSIIGFVHLFQVMNYSNAAKEDPFNEQNETFLQMEELIETKFSVNIHYEYRFKGKTRKAWINFVNLFRALLIIGTPGSGKS